MLATRIFALILPALFAPVPAFAIYTGAEEDPLMQREAGLVRAVNDAVAPLIIRVDGRGGAELWYTHQLIVNDMMRAAHRRIMQLTPMLPQGSLFKENLLALREALDMYPQREMRLSPSELLFASPDEWTRRIRLQRETLQSHLPALKISAERAEGLLPAYTSTFDEAYLRGLNVAGDVLNTLHDGQGDGEYWLHRLAVRREYGSQLRRAVETTLPRLTSLVTRASLREVMVKLEVTTSDRPEGRDYWRAKSRELDASYVAAAHGLHRLACGAAMGL